MLILPPFGQNLSVNEHSLTVCQFLNEYSYSRSIFLLACSKLWRVERKRVNLCRNLQFTEVLITRKNAVDGCGDR